MIRSWRQPFFDGSAISPGPHQDLVGFDLLSNGDNPSLQIERQLVKQRGHLQVALA
jgi:hypothetical protein